MGCCQQIASETLQVIELSGSFNHKLNAPFLGAIVTFAPFFEALRSVSHFLNEKIRIVLVVIMLLSFCTLCAIQRFGTS